MKLYVKSQGGELTVPSQSEFLVLWQRGFIAPDDLVMREGVERWVPAGDLPWIRGMTDGNKKDNVRLVWLTLAMMLLGLCLLLYLQSHTRAAPRRVHPPGAVKAVPAKPR